LFDGFPRTLYQAEALDRLLHRCGTPLDVVIELKADEQELIQRIDRRSEQEHRSDDTSEAILERMRVYRSQTAPLVEYYQRRGLLQSVNAMGTPDEVFQRILGSLPARK
jgi:adenylate kinase